MKTCIITWAVSVLSACIIAAAWIHTHPPVRLARVDIKTLVDEYSKTLTDKAKPGMAEAEQVALLKAAADYGAAVEGAVSRVARECGCAVLNSAAILKLPEGEAGIPDLTGRVRVFLQTAQNSVDGNAGKK